MDTPTAVRSYAPTRALFFACAFCIPAFMWAPQWVTGSLVNGLLYLSVRMLTRRDRIPLVIIPSLGALSHGVLFGPHTLFLVYFLPFIWLGNYIYMVVSDHLDGVGSVIIPALAKASILWLLAILYARVGIVPNQFIASMGAVQIITALTGGFISYGYLRYILRYE